MRHWVSIWFGILFVAKSFGQAEPLYMQPRDWLVGVREHLPDWIARPQDSGRVVGISDPGLKPDIAHGQALVRASFLYALSRGVKVAVVTDYFSFSHKKYEYELTNDKLITMIRVEAALPAVVWQTGREWVTQYGEVIVEVFADSVWQDNIPVGKLTGDLMLVSSGDLRERNELRCDWELIPASPGKISKCSYQVKGSSWDLQICTILNDTVLTISPEGYWYADQGEPGAVEGYRMNHSYWCAQMQSLFYALATHTYSEVKLKNLEEGHQETGRGLKREVIQGRLAVSLKGVGIKGNQLFVEWRVEEE